jgi:hypothetical protein
LFDNIYKSQYTTEATLTLILLTSTKWRAPASASKWQMGFNSAFKGLIFECAAWKAKVKRDADRRYLNYPPANTEYFHLLGKKKTENIGPISRKYCLRKTGAQMKSQVKPRCQKYRPT